MESKELEKNAPVELDDEVLDDVSGGDYGEQKFNPERPFIQADNITSTKTSTN